MALTFISFLLDKSYSMESRKSATLEAFNGYIATIKDRYAKDGGDPVIFSLSQFDSVGYEQTVIDQPITRVKPLTNETYVPRGGTPLIDSAYRTIEDAEKFEAANPGCQVIICIQTDGEENESRKHSWESLRGLVSRKTEKGWQFNFMGAGIDAYNQGTKMGFSVGQTMSYGDSLHHTRTAFATAAVNAMDFKLGVKNTTMYTNDQKVASGDAYMKKAEEIQEAQEKK